MYLFIYIWILYLWAPHIQNGLKVGPILEKTLILFHTQSPHTKQKPQLIIHRRQKKAITYWYLSPSIFSRLLIFFFQAPKDKNQTPKNQKCFKAMSPGPVVEAAEPETLLQTPTTDEPQKTLEPQVTHSSLYASFIFWVFFLFGFWVLCMCVLAERWGCCWGCEGRGWRGWWRRRRRRRGWQGRRGTRFVNFFFFFWFLFLFTMLFYEFFLCLCFRVLWYLLVWYEWFSVVGVLGLIFEQVGFGLLGKVFDFWIGVWGIF